MYGKKQDDKTPTDDAQSKRSTKVVRHREEEERTERVGTTASIINETPKDSKPNKGKGM